MATLQDLVLSAAINGGVTLVFLLVFAFLRLQPFADRVYYPKWYIKGLRKSVDRKHTFRRYVNLDYRAYLHFLDWMREAISMPEAELIEHAGLDSAVYLRIYLLGLKVFIPIMVFGFLILIPINATDHNLSLSSKLVSTDIDKLSIANIRDESQRLWAHIVLTYIFTVWICFVLHQEYKIVASMRFRFLKAQERRPDQFTVLVQQIPEDPDESVDVHVGHFFRVNHPDYYISHQVVLNANKLAKITQKLATAENALNYALMLHSRNSSVRPTLKKGLFGLWGEKVDSIDFFTETIEELVKQAAAERERVLYDEKAKLQVAFVSFKSRWGAAVCAQTQQSKKPACWLTEWAPEPRDVYWKNLAIPYMELYLRRVCMTAAIFCLIFFFFIPVTFVQSLANLEGIERKVKFLRPIIERKVVKSVLQGFLPGLALKLFLLLLPSVLMIMSKIEGHLSLSKLDRVSAAKQYYFMVVNVFFASVLTGTAFEQLKIFLQSPAEIPKILGDTIPMKATFFISFIMVDGWTSVAGEILRLAPFLLYHVRNLLLVKTEKDREAAMAPGNAGFNTAFPHVELYFLLGIVYAVITPFILPFIVTFFAFAYMVYRHQVINVYNPSYESAAAFWPHVHNRIVASIIVKHVTLLGVFSTKKAARSTPFLIGLPIVTLIFHLYTKSCFEPAFTKYPLEEAMAKDMIDRAKYDERDMKKGLERAYIHPILKNEEDEESGFKKWQEEEPSLVPTSRSNSLCRLT